MSNHDGYFLFIGLGGAHCLVFESSGGMDFVHYIDLS